MDRLFYRLIGKQYRIFKDEREKSMGTLRLLIPAVLITLVVAGCGVPQQQFDELKAQNRLQQDRISELENNLTQCSMNLQSCQGNLQTLRGQGTADLGARDATIAALQADLEEKKALIAKMQAQLLQGGSPLPMELNVALRDFAQKSDMITFDENTGMLKFKSDLVFKPGSDEVEPQAVEALRQLARIMTGPDAQQFDMVAVGHTDDIPIKRPATLQQHPTNWHLSVHRAISVMNVLTGNGISPERTAVKGYGEYRPIEPNKPNKGGNPVNRRVEIFIVPGDA